MKTSKWVMVSVTIIFMVLFTVLILHQVGYDYNATLSNCMCCPGAYNNLTTSFCSDTYYDEVTKKCVIGPAGIKTIAPAEHTEEECYAKLKEVFQSNEDMI